MTDPSGTLLSAYKHARIEIFEFLRIATSLGKVVERLHARNFVHGGLTPDSFFISEDFRKATLCGIGDSLIYNRVLTPVIGEEHFPYTAPERIAGLPDSENAVADLYSLGCILRELLVSEPVFAASDILTWSHAHFARNVPSVRSIRGDVPPCIDDLILRLLAKNGFDRYLSASELLAEITICAAIVNGESGVEKKGSRLKKHNSKQDRCSSLLGRSDPLARLGELLAAVARGEFSRCVFISADSGSGKTSLVSHFLNAHSHSAALIATSKAVVSEQCIPFGMVIEILKGLLRAIMSTPRDEFASWRLLISEKLSDDLLALRKIVPEFSVFMDQDRVETAQLTTNEHDALLTAVVRFIGVVALKVRPVILFLDDLQWADTHTREIVNLLSQMSDSHGILTIITFRNSYANEFFRLVPENRTNQHIQLQPLTLRDLQELVTARYHCSDDDAQGISRLLYRKTEGNPFFATQLLVEFEQDLLISGRPDEQSFRCDFNSIAQRTLTDDVLGHLRRRVAGFGLETQKLMQTIACIGACVSIDDLQAITGRTNRYELQEHLKPAVDQECVQIDSSGNCSFVHDRIWEAVYDDMELSERTSMHYQIGTRLIELLQPDSSDEALFLACTQINQGSSELVCAEHRQNVVKLNLNAAAKARSMTAYRAALNYLEMAGSLNTAAPDDYVTVRLTLLKAECHFLCNSPEIAQGLLVSLLKLDVAIPIRAEVTRILISVYTSLNLVHEAVATGLAFLEHVSITVPNCPSDAEVDDAYREFRLGVAGRSPSDMKTLSFTDDQATIAVSDVLAELIPPALFLDVNLMDLLVLKMAELGIRRGHTDSSCYGYVCLMFVIGIRYGDLANGYAFGELGVSLCEERQKYRARTLMGFGMFVLPWQRPVRDGARFIRAAFDVAKAEGDLTFAVYCGRNVVSNMLVSGVPLNVVAEEVLRAIAFAEETEFHLVIDAIQSQMVLVEALRGSRPASTGAALGQIVEQAETLGDYPMPRTKGSIAEFCFWTHRMQACVILNDLDGALAALQFAAPIAWSSRAFNEIVDFHFFGALAAMLGTQERPEAERTQTLDAKTQDSVQQLEQWAKQCPENFLGRFVLLKAHLAIINGAPSEIVITSFEHALEHAHLQGFVQDEALAYELAARYFGRIGSRSLEKQYLANARDCYARWGATEKVRLLDSESTHRLSYNKIEGNSHAALTFDALAVVKASNALTSEIKQAKVIQAIMATALETGGAQRGTLLIIDAGGVLRPAAEAIVEQDKIEVVLWDFTVEFAALPMSVVNTVSRSQRSITLDNAAQDFTFGKDPYFDSTSVCSVFCLPLVKQAKLISILYLENNLIAGAFKPSRTIILEVLASQAAIALENARLYEDLVNESRERQKTEEKLRTVQADLERASRLSTIGELAASIVHEVNQPLTAVLSNAEAGMRWLQRNEPDLDEVSAAMTRLIKEGRRAAAVVAGLRSLVKKSGPDMSEVYIDEAIAEVLILANTKLKVGSVSLDINKLELRDRPVLGDRVQLQQVLLNLINNGIEAMADVRSRERVLRISSMPFDNVHAVISVEDTGSGLPSEKSERIFEPLYSTKLYGMGMGLSICRTIVEAHGGSIWALPIEPFGTGFQFTVPFRKR